MVKDSASKARYLVSSLLILAFGIVALLVFSIWYQALISESHRQVAHTLEVKNALGHLTTALGDAETNQRGFLITGKESYLEPYRTSRENVGRYLDKLKELTQDRPAYQEALRGIQADAAKKFEMLEQTILLRQTAGFESASRVVMTDQGKEIMDGLRLEIGVMNEVEDEQLAEREKRLKSRTSIGFITLNTALFGLILAGLAVGWQLRRVLQAERTAAIQLAEHQQRLELSLAELNRSNEELSRFAFVCSHDLSEPVRMVKLYSEKLEKRLASQLEGDEKSQRYLNYLTDGASRSHSLISAVLDYGRLDRPGTAPETIDLEEMLKVVARNLEVEVGPGKSVTHGKLPCVWGIKTQVYQVLLNLVHNGLRFQDKESIPHVHLETEDRGDEWCVSVKDNGIGIEARHIPKLFKMFQRLNRREVYEGKGTGLATCRRIVEKHGGKIWVESKKGKGSIFFFTLLKKNKESDENG